MKIRDALEIDIPYLIQIVIEYKKSQNILFDPNQIEKLKTSFENAIRNDKNIISVHINSENDAIDGFINLHLLDFPLIQGKELYISDLVINRGERGKGKGTALVQYAEKIAEEHDCVRIMLNNFKDSTAYEREFYKKKGFIERKNIANYVKFL